MFGRFVYVWLDVRVNPFLYVVVCVCVWWKDVIVLVW